MGYVAGTLDVPAGGGTVVVPEAADAVVFFGTNFTVMDTIVTAPGTGIFMGWAGPDIDGSGVRQGAIGIVPDGDAYCADEAAILCPSTAGTGAVLYRAELVSFDGASFTLNFTQGAAGGYKVFYLAISGFENYLATGHVGSVSTAVGWKANSVLGQSFRGISAVPAASTNFHGATWGATANKFNTPTWGYVAASSYPTSQSGQGISETLALSGGVPKCGLTTHFTGPFMITGLLNGRPTGVDGFTFTRGTDPQNFAWWLAWSGGSQFRGMNIPTGVVDAEASSTFTQMEAVDCLITFTCSDAPQGQTPAAGGAVGFSFATPDFQCCAIVDAMGTRGAFQSTTRGWASMVDSTQVRAGEVEFVGNVALLRTIDAGAVGGSLVALGLEDEEDTPGFFRVVHR